MYAEDAVIRSKAVKHTDIPLSWRKAETGQTFVVCEYDSNFHPFVDVQPLVDQTSGCEPLISALIL